MLTPTPPRLRVAAAALALCAPAVCRGAGVRAITRPSEDRTLSFTRPGRIAKLLVQEGDKVRTGQLLVQLDDEAERVELELLEVQAKDETRIQAAQAQLDQKTVEVRRLKEAKETALRIEKAEVEARIAALSLQLARLQHAQDRRRCDEAKVRLTRMQLHSPIDGRVAELRRRPGEQAHALKPGESADALQPVLRVIKINPLWINAPVPLKQARTLAVGQIASVEFDGGARWPGKVIYIAHVVDAGSNTLTVRVELPNPPGQQSPKKARARPAGERVSVTFLQKD